MKNPRLNEAQSGIKIDGRNINNLRYEDDTTLWEKVKKKNKKLKNILMKVKVESEKVSLNQNSIVKKKKKKTQHL